VLKIKVDDDVDALQKRISNYIITT